MQSNCERFRFVLKIINPAEHLQKCEVENGGQPVPEEPGGVETEEAAAGPREREGGLGKY
jgi:hypothetical protein